MPANPTTTATLELNAIDNVSAVVNRISGTVDNLSKSYDRLGGTVRGLLGVFGIAATGATFIGMIKGAIDAADQLGKLSEKTGIAVESLSGLKLAAELGDIGFEAFSKGLRGFNVSLVEAQNNSSRQAKLFQALGVDIRAGPEQAFRQFADAMAQLQDGELKTAAAIEILKKAGSEWIPVLNQGSAGIDEAQRKAQALGLVTGPEFQKQAREFNDNMKLLGKNSEALGISIARDVLPALIEMSGQVVKASERGEKWLQVWREIQKVAIATMASIHSTPAIERKAEELFAAPARQTITGKIRGLPSDSLGASYGFKSGIDEAAVAAALASNDAELKLFTSTLQGLEKEYFLLTKEGKRTALMWEEQHGSLQKLTPAHKEELLVMAGVFDAYKRDVDMRKMVIVGIEAEEAARTRAVETLQAYILTNREAANEQQFQLTLVGKSALELESLNAARKIDLELRRAVEALPMDSEGNMLTGSSDTLDALRANAENQKKLILAGIQARQDAERSWLAGTKTSFNTYIGDATNAAAQASMLFTNAFRNMEDALVNFVKTGKLDFRSLADSIITDLIRIQARKAIALGAAASSDMFSAAGDFLFGGNFASGGTMPANTWNMVGEQGPEMVFSGPGGGSVIPNSSLGGDNYFAIDARGADREGLTRLAAAISKVNGSIEGRVLHTVRRAFNQRGYSVPWG